MLIKNPNAVCQTSRSVILRDGLFLIGAETCLIIFIGNILDWYHGLILIGIYFCYGGYMIYKHKSSNNILKLDSSDVEQIEPHCCEVKSWWKSLVTLDIEYVVLRGRKLGTFNAWALLGVATSIIAGACFLLVHACEEIGLYMGIHGYFVAVIIAAGASSIPDTILSIKDAKKGNYDDAISNALGSNIFDICFALGLPLLIYTLISGPIHMEKEMVRNILELRIILLIMTTITFFLFLFFKRMTKKLSVILLMMYGVFVGFVIGRAIGLF